MAIINHPHQNQKPQVYDKQDHLNFAHWYFVKFDKLLTKSEMDRTRENFTYDMEYYLSLPNPSKNFEVIENEFTS